MTLFEILQTYKVNDLLETVEELNEKEVFFRNG